MRHSTEGCERDFPEPAPGFVLPHHDDMTLQSVIRVAQSGQQDNEQVFGSVE